MATGLNWSELARRALNNMYEAFYAGSAVFRASEQQRRLSEKGGGETQAAARKKAPGTRGGRKG